MTGIAEKRGKEKRIAVPGVWWRYPAVFLLAFLMAWLSLSVILVRHHGLLTLCNDYQEQYIPFTMLFASPGAGALISDLPCWLPPAITAVPARFPGWRFLFQHGMSSMGCRT